jgi:hypothetical protein
MSSQLPICSTTGGKQRKAGNKRSQKQTSLEKSEVKQLSMLVNNTEFESLKDYKVARFKVGG